jgi:hypothetical protein
VQVGASKLYLTVGTYPFPGAYPAITRAATSKGSASVKRAHGGLAVLDGAYPESVHLAYPGVRFFGHLTAPPAAAPAGKPAAASVADLESLAKSIGQPIYWAVPKAGYTYERAHPERESAAAGSKAREPP